MLLPATAVVVTSLNGGSYSTVARSACGALVWAAAIGLIVLGKWPRRWPSRETWAIGAGLGALVLLAGISMLWSESPERSYLEMTKLLLYLGVFLLAAVCAQHVTDRRPLVDGLTLGLAVVVVLAAVSRLEPGWFPTQDLHVLNPETAPRLSYPFNYWNGVGLLVAMAVPLLLYRVSRPDAARASRAAAAAVLPAAGLTLFLTYSRGSLVATAAAALVVAALLPARGAAVRATVVGAFGAGILIALVSSYAELSDGRLDTAAASAQGHRVLAVLLAVSALAFFVSLLEPERRWTARPGGTVSARRVRIVLVVAAALLAIGAGVAVVSQWDDFRAGGARLAQAGSTERFASASGNGRYQYWDAALHAFASRPVAGRGAGTWQFWWQRHATLDAPVRDSHSMIFDAMAELGVLGLLAVLGTLGAVLWAGVRRVRRDRDPALVAALLGLSSAFVISAAIDWTWEIPALGMIFFAAAGLMAARGSGEDEDRVRPDRRFAAGVAFAVLGWAALVGQVMALAAAAKLDQSRSEARAGHLDAAHAAASSAASLGPWSASARRQLAQVLESQGQLGDARDKAREAVAKEKTNWENWFVLAHIEAQLGDTDLALADLRRARDLNPRSTIWRDLGFVDRQGRRLAIADPDFVSDDSGSALVGGTPSTKVVLEGKQSRIVATGASAEFPQLRGLDPGARYEVRFAVRSLAGAVPSGRVGDTSGSGWTVRTWTGRAHGWTRIAAELTATATTERLAFLVDGGGPVAIDAISVVRVGDAAP